MFPYERTLNYLHITVSKLTPNIASVIEKEQKLKRLKSKKS